MKILLFIFILFQSSALMASFSDDYKKTCRSLKSIIKEKIDGKYCLYEPKHSTSTDLIYHLHGMFFSEKSWGSDGFYTAQIRDEWKANDVNFPTVVSISFDKVWLLAEKNSSDKSGLFEVFTKKIMPKIESKIKFKLNRRILWGESMGGYNSSLLALKTNYFDKAAILCAPMSTVTPFAAKNIIKKHIENTAAWSHYEKISSEKTVWSRVYGIVKLAKSYYPSPEEYKLGNPLALAKTSENKSTKFYVSVGYYDQFASFEANKVFYKILKNRGYDVTWRQLWGEHCSMDIQSLAKFFIN